MFRIDQEQTIGIIGSGEVGQNIYRELKRLFDDRVTLTLADSSPSRVGVNTIAGVVESVGSLVGEPLDMLILGYRADDRTYDEHRRELASRFSCPIVTAHDLFAVYPGVRGWKLLEKHNALKLSPLVDYVSELLSDAESQSQFRSYYRWVCREAGAAPAVGIGDNQYFNEQIIELKENEVVVDCGAYIGDTLRSFTEKVGNKFSEYYAFEPDNRNFAQLTAYVASLPPSLQNRIHLFNSAVAARTGYLNFAATASQNSRRQEQGGTWIHAYALADFQFRLTPTFVKLDLEGADLDALMGVLPQLLEWRPKICVAIYHNPQDFIKIPILLMTVLERYEFSVRAHNEFGLDFVLYCVPIQCTA